MDTLIESQIAERCSGLTGLLTVGIQRSAATAGRYVSSPILRPSHDRGGRRDRGQPGAVTAPIHERVAPFQYGRRDGFPAHPIGPGTMALGGRSRSSETRRLYPRSEDAPLLDPRQPPVHEEHEGEQNEGQSDGHVEVALARLEHGGGG